MKTKKQRSNNQNKTKKNNNTSSYPSMKILKKGFPIYASKTHDGQEILDYTKEQEKNQKKHCINENLNWFGDYEEAKHYKSSKTKIYKWIMKKETRLINMNEKNSVFFKKLFQTDKSLVPAIQIDPSKLKKLYDLKQKMIEKKIDSTYLYMSPQERALYEFQFAYGYISAEQQYQFMKFIRFLIENDITDIKRREGISIIEKIKNKINYYYLLNKTNHTKHNRLSFYAFDKCALTNLCRLLPKKYKIEGVLQANEKSFWFPDLIIYKMNIKEYVLFNPHRDLHYVSEVE
jgi:hypothetical protein